MKYDHFDIIIIVVFEGFNKLLGNFSATLITALHKQEMFELQN